MADEKPDESQKTEEPTPKRLEDARKKGDMAKSQDVPIWFLFFGGAALVAFTEPIIRGLGPPLVALLDHPHTFHYDEGGMMRFVQSIMWTLTPVSAIIFGIVMLSALSGHLIQHRPLWTLARMKPKLSKISPIDGLKRMFGAQGWMNFFKSIAKMVAIMLATIWAFWPSREILISGGAMELGQLLNALHKVIGNLFIAALVVVGLIAAFDIMWQKQSFMKRMRMTRQEVRDEMKQSDGDPHVKARLRQIRQERSRKRMLAAVPEASVVVTNPTHYSVALKYVPEETPAPICIAKGIDTVALRIREAAVNADVPLVENPALARALYATAELDEPIPREHFEAVAKIISFVMQAAQRRYKGSRED